MALDSISGTTYNDTASYSQKQKVNMDTSQGNTVNISINELPGTTKATDSNQTRNEQGNGQKEKSITQKQIKDAISQANNKLKEHRTRCEFSYHEDTKRVSIKVIDRDTDDVIKEIPPEETLEMVEKMWELAGILVDEKR